MLRRAPQRSFKKRLLSNPFSWWLIALLVSVLVRLIYVTARIEKQIPAAAEPYFSGEKPAIFCFWHGRLLMHLTVKPPVRPMYVLASHHNDGTLIAGTMRRFGIDQVRGSRNRGGAQALLALFKITHAGGNISITPDGPRGPFQKAAQGAAFVAAKTGYPIIPITFSATRYRRLRTWDRFMIPRLFSRIVFIAAEPMVVDGEADAAVAVATQQLEQTLARITADADRQCGVGV